MERSIPLIIKTNGAYCGDETGDCPQMKLIAGHMTCKCALFEISNIIICKPECCTQFLRSPLCVDYFDEREILRDEEEKICKIIKDGR